MWSAPASVRALLPHVVRAAEHADFSGLVVVLARTADARQLHRELTRDWTSIHDVTGHLIAVLCPDPIPWRPQERLAQLIETSHGSVDTFAHMHDLSFFALGGHEKQLDSHFADSVSRHSPPGTLVIGHAWAQAPYTPKEHHAAWTEATSRCATYFGIPEAQLPSILILSFEEKAAVLIYLADGLRLPFYGLCKQIATDLGYTKRASELREQSQALGVSKASARRAEERAQAGAQRINHLYETLQDGLEDQLGQRMSDKLRSQFQGLDKHLQALADVDPARVGQWRATTRAMLSTGTVADAYRHLFAMHRYVSDTRSQHNWLRLHAKAGKVISAINDTLQVHISWPLQSDDPIAEQMRILAEQMRILDDDQKKARLQLRSIQDQMLAVRAGLDEIRSQQDREGLAAASETAARRLIGAAETQIIQGKAGLAGYQLRVIRPTARPIRPAQSPGASLSNSFTGTVRGPVIQAGQIHGDVHVHHTSLFAADESYPSFADRVLEQFRDWPSLEECPAGSDVALRLAGSTVQVVRLRQPDEAEVCLTWPVIQRISAALAGSGRVRVQAGSDWAGIRMAGNSDVHLVIVLASLAIRAHQPGFPD
jgi:luciferase-like monooxygenase